MQRQTIMQYLWILPVMLLVACGFVVGKPTATIDVPAIATQAAGTAVAQMTQTAAPTITMRPWPTATTTPTYTPFPTAIPLPPYTLKGLRAAYIVGGNLYVQDSGGDLTQLTDKGETRSPVIFSSDGQEIVYDEGDYPKPQEVHAINADGSDEHTIVSASLLAGLGLGYDKMTEAGFRCFIPGTHKLLFHTQQFAPEQKDFLPASNQDMLLLDLESGKIRSIFPPGKASYFQVSPDGKLIWVLSADHLDVVRLNGTLVSRLRNYPPVSNETYTGMPDLYWTQDSTKLSLVLPPRQTAMGYTGPEPRTVWQYSLGETSGSEVHLEPAPVGGNFSISPDGNWIVYYYYPIQEDSNTSVPPGIYIGDLRKGSSSLVDFVFWDQNGPIGDKIPGWFEWSPDSMHFIFNDTHEQIYLGDIQGKIITLPERGFDSWLDSRHYLFGRWAMGEIDGSNAVQVIQWPKSFAGRYIEDRTINYAGESIQTNP